jgi:hypothetical protein
MLVVLFIIIEHIVDRQPNSELIPNGLRLSQFVLQAPWADRPYVGGCQVVSTLFPVASIPMYRILLQV